MDSNSTFESARTITKFILYAIAAVIALYLTFRGGNDRGKAIKMPNMIPTELLDPNVLYGINEEWYQSPEGRKRIAEIFAHNEGMLARLFDSDAFLEQAPEEEDGPIEIASCTLEPGTPLINSEPLPANPTTKEDSQMKKGTAILFMVISLLAGFLIGQRFPTHQYVTVAGEGSAYMLLLDTKTGKVCDPFPNLRAYKGSDQVPACPH